MRADNMKILAVDDQQDYLAILRVAITREFPDALIFTATNGAQAVELALKEDPDVILLDIAMPGMDGFDVCRQLKGDDHLKNIPIMFITAVEHSRENRIKALELGGEAILAKPVETEELISLVRVMVKVKAANTEKAREAKRLRTLLLERTRGLEHELEERRQVELTLRESEEQYRTLVEKANEGIIIAQDGLFASVNRKMSEFLGMPPGELVGRPFAEFIWPEDRERVMGNYKKRISGEPLADSYDFRVAGAGGRMVWVSLSATVIKWKGRAATLSLLTDITERKRVERSLNENEARYRSLFNGSRDALMTLAPPSWHFNSGNPATLALFGVKTEEEFSACTPGDLSPEFQPDGRLSSEKAGEMIAEALRDGSRFFDWTHKKTGGEEFTATVLLTRIELSGQRFLQATVRDISESRKAADALFAVSSRQQALLAAIPDIIVEVDNNKVHTWMNPAGFEFYGEDALGKEAAFYFEGEQSTYDSVSQLFDGSNESVYVESWQRRRDGEKRLLAWWCRKIKDGAGNPVGALSTARDITELKKSEEAFRESKQLIESVVENVPLMVFLKEVKDLKFVLFNRAGEELLGYDRKDLLGKSDLDFFPPGQAAQFMSKDREVFAGDSGVLDIPEEVILTAKQGARMLHTRKVCIRGSDGAPKYLLGISEDITERRQAEANLREALEMQGVLNAMLKRSMVNTSLREKLHEHLAGLFGLPWLAVQPKGAVFLMNVRGNSLALTAQQGLAPALLGACASVPQGHCLCGKAAETGQVVEVADVGVDHHITYNGMAPHGHYCAPIVAGGKTLGVLNLYLEAGVVLTDSQRRFIRSVTDIMAENILHAQTEEKLAQSQRIESVGRLAGGVAHDFNNILTAIKCYAEFLRKGLEPQDPKLEDVREILTASDRAVALTRQLLAFSRRQIMAPKVVDLNKCVADVTNMLRRLIGEDIVLSTKLAAAPCLALLDTGQIEQVLVNLVVNARDAMPKGGGIELSTELLAASPELFLAHPDLPRGPMVCLKVSDAGTGMTAEVKSHLFEPFFTTKEQGKGTGLGLPTVFGIVKQSGGDIEVESEPDKGTVFRLYFPYCEAGSGAASANAGGAAAGEVKGLETVLLVEDEQSLRHLGRRVLESSGYIVLTATGGPDALKVLEQHGEPVDLLVTDVVMPGMSGRELARQIALKKMAARTLYMSGYTDDAIVKHGVLEPGLAFIYKPFTVDGLLLKVRTVLDAPADQARA